MPILILGLVIAVGILAYTMGWINFNPGKFKADKDAFMSKAKDSNLKEEEKVAVQKEIDETTKAISEAEAAAKKGETTESEKELQELQSKMDRLLEKSKKDPPK